MRDSRRIGQWMAMVAACAMAGHTACGQQAAPPPAVPPPPPAPAPAVAPAAAPRVLPVPGPAVPGQPAAPAEETSPSSKLSFQNAPIELVLEEYAERTGRTLLVAPDVPKAVINLRAAADLSLAERLEAMEKALAMNGIALIPDGTKFLLAVPATAAHRETPTIVDASAPPPPDGQAGIISRMISIKHMDLGEAVKIVDPLRHPFAQVQVLERVNSILITDTAANVRRILRLIESVDRPLETREEIRVIKLSHADATVVRDAILQLLDEGTGSEPAQTATTLAAYASGTPGVAGAPGVIRPPTRVPAQADLRTAVTPEPRLLRGRLKVVADARKGALVIVTRPENIRALEAIVKALDVE